MLWVGLTAGSGAGSYLKSRKLADTSGSERHPQMGRQVVVLHFSQMQPSSPRRDVEFYDVICAPKTVRGAAAERAGADDCYSPVGTVAEPGIEKLGAMLMPVQSKTESSIDQVLEDAGIHIIGLHRRSLGAVMPDSNPEPIEELQVLQSETHRGDGRGVDRALPIEDIVVVAAGESRNRHIEFGKVEYVKLFRGIEIVSASPSVELPVKRREGREPFAILRLVVDFKKLEVGPRPP